MKTLKYLAVLVFAGLALASCTDEPGLSEQNKGKAKPAVAIALSESSDTVFKFTLTPDASASQYGYVILEGKDNVAPDSLQIVLDEVSGTADAGVFNTADDPSKTIKFYCESNTDYQVFAAAITSTGLVGDVTKLNIFVPDTFIPEIVYDDDNGYSYEYEGSEIAIEYTEPVTYVKDKEITATLYAGYSYESTQIVQGYTITVIPYLVGTPVGTRTATVQEYGEWVVLDFGEMLPGTYYTIDIPDGAFVDATGNPAPGITSSFTYPYFYKGEPAFEWVLFGCTDNAPLAVTMPEQTDLEDLTAWIKVGVPSMVQKVDSKAEFKTIIKHVETNNGVSSETVTSYPMTPVTHFGGDYYAILVKPAGEPKPKDEVSIVIPKNAVVDIYGNWNDEITVGPMKYAYTPVYPNTGYYIVNNGDYPFTVYLMAMGETPEDGYALFADWFQLFGSLSRNPCLYLTVDEPARTLTCNDQRVNVSTGAVVDGCFGKAYYYYDEEHTQLLVFWGGGNSGVEPIVLTYGDSGDLTTISYCEYAIHASSGSYLGSFDYCEDGTTITKAPEEATITAQNKRMVNFYELTKPIGNIMLRK